MREVSAKQLRLRVALKLLAWFALLCIVLFSLRYVFNVPTQPRGGTQALDVATLAINQSLSFSRLGREMLLVRRSADDFLLVYQRSPEFGCLLVLSVGQKEANLKDPCTGDLFDLQGKVLPNQRAKRDLKPLPYRWLSPDKVLVED